MARGKIQIKKIENSTNRQVTFSKRRNGLFKKAHELTVLCDAKVSIIMLSSTDKLYEYISPSITTKEIYDEYQKVQQVDLWNTHYERMQDHLRKLKEINRNLRLEVRRRLGQSLNDMSYEQLCGLEQEMDESLKTIREKKYKVLNGQIDTRKKKVRNAEEINRNLMHSLSMREDPQYEIEHGGVYDDSVIGYMNGVGRVFALRMQQDQPHSHLHSGGSEITTYTLLD